MFSQQGFQIASVNIMVQLSSLKNFSELNPTNRKANFSIKFQQRRYVKALETRCTMEFQRYQSYFRRANERIALFINVLSTLLAKSEIDGFETPLSRLISNVVEQFILSASKVPGPLYLQKQFWKVIGCQTKTIYVPPVKLTSVQGNNISHQLTPVQILWSTIADAEGWPTIFLASFRYFSTCRP